MNAQIWVVLVKLKWTTHWASTCSCRSARLGSALSGPAAAATLGKFLGKENRINPKLYASRRRLWVRARIRILRKWWRSNLREEVRTEPPHGSPRTAPELRSGCPGSGAAWAGSSRDRVPLPAHTHTHSPTTAQTRRLCVERVPRSAQRQKPPRRIE